MKLKLALAAAVAALSVPSTAEAAYTITGYSLNPGNSITGNIQYTPTGLSLNVGMGRLNLTGKDANNASASFLTFCVDIFHTLTVPAQFDFKPTSTLLTDATKVSRLTTLVGMSNLLINNASDKATTSAALQLAAWEIVNEKTTNAYSFSTGDFRSSGGNSDGARTLAMTYLNNITTNKWQAPNGTLKLFYSANSQSQVLSAVPEPATWAMMIGGFGLVGGTMRRRRTAGNVVTA